MADKCGDCSCADKSQCTKKGYSFDIIETEKSFDSHVEAIVMDGAVEHDGRCKCGSSCTCTDCKCGGH